MFEVVFCEGVGGRLISCGGNRILLVRLLLWLMVSSEVLHCCGIVDKDCGD